MKKSITERFWSKVNVLGENECWEWQGGKNSDGYGNVGKWSGQWWKAHQLSYYLTYGSLPEGRCICHTCDNRSCCNPKHLWIGTHQENMDDMARKERAWGTRLSAKMAVEMRRERKAGATYRELRDKYGVSDAHITRILNKQAWKHAGG